MHYMDYNRWNGTKSDLLAFIGQQPKQPITCPIDNQPCYRLTQPQTASVVCLDQEI
jgi:hypothetical protein